VSEYKVSGCDVSTGQGPGPLATVEGGPVNAAAQPAPELSALPGFGQAGRVPWCAYASLAVRAGGDPAFPACAAA